MDVKKTARADTEYLSTLERGLSVLRTFGRETPQMTLSEVAEATGLPAAVARWDLDALHQDLADSWQPFAARFAELVRERAYAGS